MKILYGVQATGNGHITRARIMTRALADIGAEVDLVFSGRRREDFFDMEMFGDFRVFRGLTFVTKGGGVHHVRTIVTSNFLQLYRDIKTVSVEGYDLILNDFEPVTAWAARLAGKEVFGLSHQNAFLYDIPKVGDHFIVSRFMRSFAPVSRPIGLHWHHFNQPILPPLVEPSCYPNAPVESQYLVYLPFCELTEIVEVLKKFSRDQFYIYHRVNEPLDEDNIHLRPFSREGFQRDLHSSKGVICNAGFELSSEAIHLGKKLLVQPVEGQMEQQSNARALSELGYGTVFRNLNRRAINDWLALPAPKPVIFPDVARALAQWFQSGAENFPVLQTALWTGTAESK